jgi:protoporphyrin/coproporphyrin ferrochelatase
LAGVALSSSLPFQAVLLVSFGGPQGPADIRPFLQNVLRGRRVPPERVEEVAHHYELFGGVSPLTMYTQRQAAGLALRLQTRGYPLPVHVGMRNWHPFLADTMRAMHADGVRRAVGLIAAAHRSYSSCTQYRENVRDARTQIQQPLDVVYTGDWHTHDGFIEAVADHIEQARATLPADVRHRARIVFTAHSIPTGMAHADTYQRQLQESARAVAQRLNTTDWSLVYQSRSGRPQDPWLEPDVNDYLRTASAQEQLAAVIIAPLGFVCDHVEVLYDLDIEAKATCEELGLPMARAAAVNDHPRFIDAMADAVIATVDRYGSGRPLALAFSSESGPSDARN